MVSAELIVLNKSGLHARAAAILVQQANKFNSEIMIRKDSDEVNGKSIMGVLMLAVTMGTKVTLTADGPDEDTALETLMQLFNDKFGEDD